MRFRVVFKNTWYTSRYLRLRFWDLYVVVCLCVYVCMYVYVYIYIYIYVSGHFFILGLQVWIAGSRCRVSGTLSRNLMQRLKGTCQRNPFEKGMPCF